LANPLFSIITFCYNAGDLLRGTIESIAAQTFRDFEYIIVDGGSTDGTAQLAKQHSALINIFESEPDKGIYDAMNKGIRFARGEFIWFLNAGDELFDRDILAKLAMLVHNDIDVLYGEVMIVDNSRTHLGTRSELTVHQLPGHLRLNDMQRGMIVNHQGFVPRARLVHPFIENNLSADIKWVIDILRQEPKVLNTGLVLAEYLAGGISKQKWYQSLSDRWKILQHEFGLLPTIRNHAAIVFRAVIHRLKRGNKPHY